MNETKWYDVKYHLPPLKDEDNEANFDFRESEPCLVVNKHKRIYVATLRKYGTAYGNYSPEWIQYGRDGYEVTDEITHWTNLPEPPKYP